MSGLISIIVPIYNVDEYLEECLKSIYNQTLKNFEVILIDDGSTDRSPALAKKYANEDKRFKYFRYDNGGLSVARNRGLGHASGDYLLFIDSDDYVKPDYVERLFGGMSSPEIDVVSTQLIYSFAEGSKYPEPFGGTYGKKEYFQEMLAGKFKCHVCGRLFRSAVFESIRFRENFHFEDVFIFADWIDKVETVKQLEYMGYFYRQRRGSITRSVKSHDFEVMFKAHEVIRNNSKNLDIHEVYYFNHLIDFLLKPLVKIVFAGLGTNAEIEGILLRIRGFKSFAWHVFLVSPKNFLLAFSLRFPFAVGLFKAINYSKKCLSRNH